MTKLSIGKSRFGIVVSFLNLMKNIPLRAKLKMKRITAGIIDQMSMYVTIKAYDVSLNMTLARKNGVNLRKRSQEFFILRMVLSWSDRRGEIFISYIVLTILSREKIIDAIGREGRQATLPR